MGKRKRHIPAHFHESSHTESLSGSADFDEWVALGDFELVRADIPPLSIDFDFPEIDTSWADDVILPEIDFEIDTSWVDAFTMCEIDEWVGLSWGATL